MSTPWTTVRVKSAAVASVLLAWVYAVRLPDLADAAPYLGVVGLCLAVTALVAGGALWFGRWTLGWTLVTAAVFSALAGQLLYLLVGLPGARTLEDGAGPALVAVTLGTEVVIVVLLLVEAFRRSPVTGDEDTYAQ